MEWWPGLLFRSDRGATRCTRRHVQLAFLKAGFQNHFQVALTYEPVAVHVEAAEPVQHVQSLDVL